MRIFEPICKKRPFESELTIFHYLNPLASFRPFFGFLIGGIGPVSNSTINRGPLYEKIKKIGSNSVDWQKQPFESELLLNFTHER